MIPIYLLTNDKHRWLLPGFAYLFNTFWSVDQPVIVAGYGEPYHDLPRNFKFQQIAPENYPVGRWSDGLIELVERSPYTRFVLMLEDYWLCAPTDVDGVDYLYEWMRYQPDVLRLDLTADRVSKRPIRDAGRIGKFDLVATAHTAYCNMSFQAGIWNRQAMLEILRRGETPWAAEIDGTKRLQGRPDLRVLGTKQEPVKYRPVFRTRKGRGSFDMSAVPQEHQDYIRGQGWADG